MSSVYDISLGGSSMCNNNSWGGGNCCWIIILLIIIWFCCGNTGLGSCGNNCGCSQNTCC